MNDIARHVTSLELSKKLKELGLRQSSILYWCNIVDKVYFKLNEDGTIFEDESGSTLVERKTYRTVLGSSYAYNCEADQTWSAFLASELGEILPSFIEDMSLTCFMCSRGGWWIQYDNGHGEKDGSQIWDKSLSNSLAKMLIHLIENNLISDKWKKKWMI